MSSSNMGLYHPSFDRDSCGFGLLVQRDNRASRWLVESAIHSLDCLTHRGAIAEDGLTGDGCGLLFKQPKDFLRRVAEEQGIILPDRFGVAMVFMNADAVAQSQQAWQHGLAQHQLHCLGWRAVPVNPSACGKAAQASQPSIWQLFISGPDTLDDLTLERRLFLARKSASQAMVSDPHFYVASCSLHTIIYKGMVLPSRLMDFFSDLAAKDFQSSLALFHQRFSTNTAPQWRLAQPFRYLAHNGEINTIRGNRHWAEARSHILHSPLLPDLQSLRPLVNQYGSDSSSLDNMLELLVQGGMDWFRAIRLLIPPAWQNLPSMDPALRAFYEYNATLMEPWDGPAGIVLTNGQWAGCIMDRNGLRPARYSVSDDGHVVIASETGVGGFADSAIISKGRLQPGEMMAIDTCTGQLLDSQAIDRHLVAGFPYRQWLKQHSHWLQGKRSKILPEQDHLPSLPRDQLAVYQKLFHVSREEQQSVLQVLAQKAHEPVSSMGDDTPLAVLSRQNRSFYDYFRQCFAQVTNPPIDPLREALVMSLRVYLGSESNAFNQDASAVAENRCSPRWVVDSPILTPGRFQALQSLTQKGFHQTRLSLYYPADLGLVNALDRLCQQAEQAVASGAVILCLSDHDLKACQLPIQAPLAVGAVHQHLVKNGQRCLVNLLVETGSARDSHQMAVLLGLGATLIYPYLAYDCLRGLSAQGALSDIPPSDLATNYRRAINAGLMKIISKMGICTIDSYRGAQLFDVIGLHQAVVGRCCPEIGSRIQGADFEDLQADAQQLVDRAWNPQQPLAMGGHLKYIHGEEYHAYHPDVVHALQQAAVSPHRATYRRYQDLVNQRPVTVLRDLLDLVPQNPACDIEQVEPVEGLFRRFDTAAMSLGALSPEAHETLALAMNQLGGHSNSGEGGEDPQRYNTLKNSRIKQIASGRFGVTAAYLRSADVLQIKIAQGAKPGEGGQLPGHKVTRLIARLRYAKEGVALISPPPHHDIYSIEDLAQLIFDLKQVNPQAMVSVKLVSAPGIGAVAAGVVKAYADLITVAGYDGGTGASPVTSVHHAGSPWELGLAEVQQTLRQHGLRHRVRLQVDGGFKTGLDVIKGAILGAESFGFGTAPMIAMGCKYLRICHLNNCATGVATQHRQLRDRYFVGSDQRVKQFFHHVAEEVRQWLAFLGATDLQSIIGRTELLRQLPGDTRRQHSLDLSPLLHQTFSDQPHYCTVERNPPFDQGRLAKQISDDLWPAIRAKQPIKRHYVISNQDRSIGARLAGEIVTQSPQGIADHPLQLHFHGSAGQSFGAFGVDGMELLLQGDANDYVGKGMAGGHIIIKPPADAAYRQQVTPLVGNTCLYGATGGQLYVAGGAGERFAVRNSGALAVIEQAGQHCCEYMTGGVVVVLGETGSNFGAGMTGGMALVLADTHFHRRYHRESVLVESIDTENRERYADFLHELIHDFYHHTQSLVAQRILEDFDLYLAEFLLVAPRAANINRLLDHAYKAA